MIGASPTLANGAWRWSAIERVAIALAVTLVPILAFAAAALACLFLLLWQSPAWPDRLLSLFSIPGSWPFYLLAAFSGIGALRLLVNPTDAAHRPWVRLAVYAGLVLNIQYSLLALLSFYGEPFTSGWTDIDAAVVVCFVLAPIVALAYTWASLRLLNTVRKSCGRAVTAFVAAALIAGYAAVTFAVFTANNKAIGLFLVVVVCCALPLWPLMAYSRLTYVLRRHMRPPIDSKAITDFARPAVWLTSYGAAWTVSVYGAVTHYQSLSPTSRGLCYVATAASRGHRWLVGSRHVMTPRGTVLLNNQMRYLICAEIVLHYLCPPAQRAIRRSYDRVGPPLAKSLTTPWLADIGYLAMKPAEWAAWLLLRCCFTNPPALIARLGSISSDE